jgi:ribose 5-phosphate isomerase B
MNTSLKISIASDHAGVDLKSHLIQELQSWGFQVQDFGPADTIRCDYPQKASLVAQDILQEKSQRGILICGSGIGMSIAANRFTGIRAALAHSVYTAQMSRLHNDAQILCLGARILDPTLATEMLKTFLETEFEGERHAHRVAMLDQINQNH